jgi:hypothetical protein
VTRIRIWIHLFLKVILICIVSLIDSGISLHSRWLQAFILILEKAWDHRLQEGHYPSRDRFLGNCALDANY